MAFLTDISLRTLIGVSAGVGISMLSGAAWAQDPLKLRISTEQTPGVSGQVTLASFRDALKEEMGSSVEIEYFDSGQIGDEIVHMEQLRTGQIDIVPLGSDVVQLDSKWAVFDMPFLFETASSVYTLVDGPVGTEMAESLAKSAGLHVLGFGETGFRHVTNNIRPIVTPDDLKGLRLRVPGSASRLAIFENFGANPVSMSTGELYLSFQQGTVDGHENAMSSIKSWSFHEVQDYISLTSHVYTPVTLAMNQRKWQSLTPEQQSAIEKASATAVAYSRQYAAETDEQLRAELTEYLDINDVDRPAFLEEARKIWPKISAIAGEEFATKVIEMVENLQKSD